MTKAKTVSSFKNMVTASHLLVLFAVLGFLDASYLAYEHYFGGVPPCTVGAFSDCGRVLTGPYSMIGSVPLAILGMIYYCTLIVAILVCFWSKKNIYKRFALLVSATGFAVSIYLTFLQFFVIKAICQYCLLSAVISMFIYFCIRYIYRDVYQQMLLLKVQWLYRLIAKPLFFILDPEFVHDSGMTFGEWFGNRKFVRTLFSWVFHFQDMRLRQKVQDIIFTNPVGLSAGYDYYGSFTRILPCIGFGFETIGTITNQECEGNQKPRLGRLPRSKALLVNKGFRNPGAEYIISKLHGKSFEFPVGVSIGTTNTIHIKTQTEAIADVVHAFRLFEKSQMRHAFYELNISCPNLQIKISFYEPSQLRALLKEIEKLHLKRPVFVKMPIDKSDAEILALLKTMSGFPIIKGVIFGNLQKNRLDPSLDPLEVANAGKGHFSGKPTWIRSNTLIALAYRNFAQRFVIVGCGGIFSAEDAYTKIRLGATLVQLITGMIYEGPQMITQINRSLVEYLKRDGFHHISEAIGIDA